MKRVVWSPGFDISTVPDEILHRESARRRRAAQAEPPRAPIRRACEFCFELFGAREMRKHRPRCPNRDRASYTPRPGWKLEVGADPKRMQRDVYRYWQSRPIAERLAAVWDVTQAAYSIRRVE